MKSKYTGIVLVIGAVLAFLPILGVGFLLDGYIRAREHTRLQSSVDHVTVQVQEGVYQGLKAIRAVIDASPSLCTPSFLTRVREQLRAHLALRNMVVENADRVQYCDGFGDDVSYRPLTGQTALPGRPDYITIAELDGANLPVIKVSHPVGDKVLSIFVYADPDLERGLPPEIAGAAMFRLTLTSGDTILTLGDNTGLADVGNDRNYLVVNSFASEFPIRAEAVMPFAPLKAQYAGLDIAVTIMACLTSAALLLVIFHYARRAKLHALDLEHAIASGELRPYYQPVIDLGSGRIVGCEVLVRWIKRSGETVPPSVFIDYAEASGLAIPMTIHIMQRVKRELAALCAEQPHLKIAINLFAGHFRDTTIVEDVQAIFGGSSIKLRQLVFEITERTPFTSNLQANSVIAGLHSIGARVALDDVGTGHSNLAYVQTLGVDIIKIDRVFMDMITEGVDHVPVLDGLITMARELGTEVVAEGVETEAQALYLRERGVDQAQGFLFAPALKPDSFVELVRGLNGTAKAPVSEGSKASAPLPGAA